MRLFRIFDFKPNPDQDVQDEIDSHLELEVDNLVQNGMPEGQAQVEAERRFGDRARIGAEASRHAQRWARRVKWRSRLELVWRDTQHAARRLVRTKTTSAIIVLLLALGIGTNTALFSTLKAVYLNPLPLPDSEELVFLWEQTPETEEGRVSFPNFTDLRTQNRTFQEMGAYLARRVNLTDLENPVRVRSALTTASLFHVLGMNPALGRYLTSEDDFSGVPVVVLGNGIWRNRYGGDPDIVGSEVDLDGTPHTVVGVMPEDFQHPDPWSLEPIQVWVPLPSGTELEPRISGSYQVLGRLREGAGLAEARGDLGRIADGLADAYPESNAETRIRAEAAHVVLFGEAGSQILLILGAAGLVLLIACGNIAALQLARAPERQTDVAIRSALGASRGRLLRMLLTENLLLAIVGGLAGVLAAVWMLNGLERVIPASMPRAGDLGLDWTVFLVAMGVSLVVGFGTGLMPARSISGDSMSDTLREGRRGFGRGRGRGRLRAIPIIGQVAVSLVLANAALLLLQSFNSVRRADLGFDPGNVLTMSLSLRGSGYSIVRGRAEFYDELFPLVRALPGVTAVGATTSLPLMAGTDQAVLSEEAWADGRLDDAPTMKMERVTGEFFSAMGIPLMSGQLFRRGVDDPRLEDIRAVLSQAAVDLLWPGEDPIGKRFSFSRPNSQDEAPRWITVIGVVGDVRNQSLELSPSPEVYLPYASFPPGTMSLAVKGAGDPTALGTAIREQIKRVDPLQAVSDVRTMDDLIHAQGARRGFYTILIGAFSGLALLLVAVGVYGVISQQVAERKHEMGIRLALGAESTSVQKLVIGSALRLALIGLAIGSLGVAFSSATIRSFLYGVRPFEPMTFGFGCVLLLALSLGAAFGPVRRAAKVDPALVLRGDE